MQRLLRNMVIGMGVVIALLLVLLALAKPDMKEINQKANANLPKMIDKNTRMESVKVTPESVTYNYTLIDFTPNESAKSSIQSGIQTSTCAKMGKEIQDSMSYHFIYHLENGTVYAKVDVTKELCKQ